MSDAITILYSDDTMLVIAKSAGVPSQSDPTGDPSALELAGESIGRPLHPVHRIDRPASGLLLAACTAGAASELSAMLRAGRIQRRYWAIVQGRLESEGGRLEHRLRRDGRTNKTRVDADGKPAVLTWTVRTRGDRYTLVEVELATGRHHQVRAQLAASVAPVRGDLKYGARRSQPGGGIALHAVGLALNHPVTGERCVFTAPPPSGRLWEALAGSLEPRFADDGSSGSGER